MAPVIGSHLVYVRSVRVPSFVVFFCSARCLNKNIMNQKKIEKKLKTVYTANAFSIQNYDAKNTCSGAAMWENLAKHFLSTYLFIIMLNGCGFIN